MSIYELDIKQMRKVFREFHRTLYGATVFFLAYFIPLLLFLAMMISAILGMITQSIMVLFVALGCVLGFLVTFILGNIYFYVEVRKFCERKK